MYFCKVIVSAAKPYSLLRKVTFVKSSTSNRENQQRKNNISQFCAEFVKWI